MTNEVVPTIPSEILEVLNNKKFGASDIKWIKTVNDDSVGNPSSSSAYLSPDPRVIANSNGIFFCLQINSKFKETLQKVRIGELIILYQLLNTKRAKCFTHLVTPVRNEVTGCPVIGPDGKSWYERWVQAGAMTENQAVRSIPLISTDWLNMGFTGPHRDLSHQDGRVREIAHNQQLSSQQLSE